MARRRKGNRGRCHRLGGQLRLLFITERGTRVMLAEPEPILIDCPYCDNEDCLDIAEPTTIEELLHLELN